MKKKIYISIILFAFLALHVANGQETDLYKVRSPQSADMLRYGNVPVAKNSGRLDLSIDLIGIDDPDFNFPVSIRYNSSGYIPSKAESSVGLDWSLIAGGAIYREVRYMPDDLYVRESTYQKGFLSILKEGINLDKNQIFENPSQHIELTMSDLRLKELGIEVSSDIYQFSFGPYSGKFTINFDGTVNVLSTSGGKFKVDLSGYNYSHLDTSIIRITTDNGYVYSFGGTKDAMEYTINYSSPSEYTTTPLLSSFHLYEILAPNGRKLEIEYYSVGDLHTFYSNLLEFIGGNQQYLKNYSFSSCPVSFSSRFRYADNGIYYKMLEHVIPQFSDPDSHMLTKVALISEIKTDEQSIKFHYSSRPNVIYDPLVVGEFSANCGAKLDSICLKKSDVTIKKVDFSYSTYSTNSRFFLNKLILPDSETYVFDYNHNYHFPVPRTKDVDYWGFWRNTGEDVGHIDVPDDSYNLIDYISERAEEESAKAGFDHALLKRIIYPTGGYTDISYEHHRYAKKIDIVTNANFTPMVYTWPKDLKAGGARVKYLKNYTDGKVETKMFKYLMDPKNEDSRSSGIISHYPRYADYFYVPKEGSNASTFNGTEPSYHPYNGINFQTKYMDHISYSRVTEISLEEEVFIPGTYTYISSPLVGSEGEEITIHPNLVLDEPAGMYSWRFEGSIGGNTTEGATIYFTNTYNNNVVATVNLYGNQVITDRPTLGTGTYKVTLVKTGRYFVKFDIVFPHGDLYYWTGPYTTTQFSDYNTNPDNFFDDKVLALTNNNYSTYAWNSQRDVQRRTHERGLILKEEHYDSTGILMKKNEYTYRSDDSRFSANFGVYGRVMYGLLYQISKDYFYPYYLVEKKTTDYSSNNGNISGTTSFSYNTDGYLKETVTQNSDGKSLQKKMYYPFDISNSIHQNMINRNMLSNVIREESYINGQKAEQINTNFISVSGLPVVGSLERGKSTNTPVEYVRYGDHNSYGNPRTIVQNDNLKTALLWGYNNQYIVAKIEGASYTEIEGFLTENLVNTIAGSSTFTDDQAKEIRNKLSGKNVFITTYAYKPLVGVIKVIDPRGCETYYNYDSFNRLKEIYILNEKKQKEILEAYEYNYVNQ